MRKNATAVVVTFGLLLSAPLRAQWSTAAHSLRDATAIIRVVYNDGTSEKTLGGTGFFVAVEDPRVPAGKSFGYLVTNRHVARAIVNGAPSTIVGEYARLNLVRPSGNREWDEIQLPISGPGSWSFPQDDSVDLAALPLAPDPKMFYYRGIPTSAFATEDIMKSDGITEGADVILAGYFYPFAGTRKIQPLVRHGILAMSPNEPVPMPGGVGSAYLIDLHILHGNSGSPVMVCNGSPSLPGVIVLGSGCRLLGVVSGFYFEDEDLELKPATLLSGNVKANSGVSFVVPAGELLKLLTSAPLRESREAQIKALGLTN
jgi:hypothetical protein